MYVYVKTKASTFYIFYRMVEVGRHLWRRSPRQGRRQVVQLPAQAGPPGADCPGPCPDDFCEHLRSWRLHSLSGQPVLRSLTVGRKSHMTGLSLCCASACLDLGQRIFLLFLSLNLIFKPLLFLLQFSVPHIPS